MIKQFIQAPFNLLNIFIPKIRFELTIKRKTYFIKNVFGSTFNKKAIVIYLSDPFNNKLKNKHTNHVECYLAAKCLHDLGYNVDVVDFDYSGTIEYSDYKVIYGFGDQFEQSFYSNEFKGKRIVYSPGCNTVYSNKESAKKLKQFAGAKNPKLIRATNNAWPLQKYLSDAIICLGNQFVLNTYRDDFPEMDYYSINCFPLDRPDKIEISGKDFTKAKNNILWFGSQGTVHKGLDTALALIERNPNLKLFVRGIDLNNEGDVLLPFKHLISTKRVDVKEYVDVKSKEFEWLMLNCAASVFPSASEGGAAALLTVMTHGGLIPIITKPCGLDVEHLGFVALSSTLNDVEEAFLAYLKLTPHELQQKSTIIQNEISKVYNKQNYELELKQILSKILA